MGVMGNAYKIWFENLRGTSCSGKPRHGLYDAMKVNLRKTGCDGRQWI
jgi:hypothetical protein